VRKVLSIGPSLYLFMDYTYAYLPNILSKEYLRGPPFSSKFCDACKVSGKKVAIVTNAHILLVYEDYAMD
jgi:hypothetical protein